MPPQHPSGRSRERPRPGNPVIRPGRPVGVAPRLSSYLLSDSAARLLERERHDDQEPYCDGRTTADQPTTHARPQGTHIGSFGRRPAVGSVRSSPGSARCGTATSVTRSPPISTAALRASPKPGCRSCSVRRNAGRTPSLRNVGGLRPIRARTRSLRACFRWSGPHTATDSGAVSAGSNPAGGTGQRHKFEHFNNLEWLQCQRCDLRKRDAFRIVRPIRALQRKAGPANCLLSSITRSRSLGRKQAVAPAPTRQLHGSGLHPKYPPTRGLPGGWGNLSHLLGTGTKG
jgi:hypothetical protein